MSPKPTPLLGGMGEPSGERSQIDPDGQMKSDGVRVEKTTSERSLMQWMGRTGVSVWAVEVEGESGCHAVRGDSVLYVRCSIMACRRTRTLVSLPRCRRGIFRHGALHWGPRHKLDWEGLFLADNGNRWSRRCSMLHTPCTDLRLRGTSPAPRPTSVRPARMSPRCLGGTTQTGRTLQGTSPAASSNILPDSGVAGGMCRPWEKLDCPGWHRSEGSAYQ